MAHEGQTALHDNPTLNINISRSIQPFSRDKRCISYRANASRTLSSCITIFNHRFEKLLKLKSHKPQQADSSEGKVLRQGGRMPHRSGVRAGCTNCSRISITRSRPMNHQTRCGARRAARKAFWVSGCSMHSSGGSRTADATYQRSNHYDEPRPLR